MQLYFIRHGQSINNAKWDSGDPSEYNRHADPVLTEVGKKQALYAAKFLSRSQPQTEMRWIDPQNACGFGLTHLYCSLMERAVQTGSIISKQLGVPLEGFVDLHEVGGIYLKEPAGDKDLIRILHGHNRQYFQKSYPDLNLPTSLDGSGWWQGGIEPPENRFDRARRIIDFFLQKHAGTQDKIGVIIHGGIYTYIFRLLFNIATDNPGDLDLPFRIIINNCSISRYDFNDEGFMLLYHNRVDFLPPELIT